MTLIVAAVAALGLLQEDRIEELIKRLAAEEFSVREKATKELAKIGKPAEPALRKALESEDPEVRQRVKRILESLKPSGPEKKAGTPGRPRIVTRGGSVSVQSVNGNSTYVITPGDGRPAITFYKSADGRVQLKHQDAEGKERTVQAESIDKFVENHAVLAKKYGISKDGIAYGGARASFRGGLFRGFEFGKRFRFNPDDFKFDPEKFRGPFKFRRLRPPARSADVAGARLDPVSEALRAHFDIPEGEGRVVKDVTPGRPAHAAGLRKNDVLLAIDGKPVRSARDARERLKPDSSVTVLRKGERKTLTPSKKEEK